MTASTRNLKRTQTILPLLEGGRGSLASSLDYALSKQPAWLFNMFGSDDRGDAFLRKLLFRSNSGLRRAGFVSISLNESLLDPRNIKVYFEGRLVSDAEKLEYLMKSILMAEYKNSPTEMLSTGYSNHQEQQNSLWMLGKSLGVSSVEEIRTINTDSSNIDKIIHPLGVSGVDNIYLFEQLQYPGSSATRDRLIAWQSHLISPYEPTPPVIEGRIVQAKHILEELTYLTCDNRTRSQFEQWIAGMNPVQGEEWGLDREKDGAIIPGFLRWIKEHNKQFTPNSFYRTFFWRDRVTKEMVATLTIAPDDRGIKDRYNLGGDGHLGGINVRWDLRYRGIGKYLAARINEYILEFANRERKSKLIHTYNLNFAGVPYSVLQRMDYVHNPVGLIETDFGVLPVWSKTYRK